MRARHLKPSQSARFTDESSGYASNGHFSAKNFLEPRNQPTKNDSLQI